MKYLLSFTIFISSIGHSQEIAMLDRNFKTPLFYTDSVTLDALSRGAFPVYLKDISPIIKAIESVRRNIYQTRLKTPGKQAVSVGHSTLTLQTESLRHARTHSFTLCTESNGYTTYIELFRGNYNRTAQQRVLAFLDYLRNNISIREDVFPASK